MMKDGTNNFIVFLTCVFGNMLDLLENILEFLLRNAYIVAAIEGTPMVKSGKRATGLLRRNLLNVLMLNFIGDGVLLMAKIFVALCTGVICYFLQEKVKEYFNHGNFLFI